MASETLKNLGKIGTVAAKVSEIVGEFGGWMSVLGLGRHRPSGDSKHEAGLTANAFGIGLDDETLFWEAVALAIAKGFMDKVGGNKNLNEILGALEYREKARFWKIIGKGEQSVTFEIHAKSVTSVTPTTAAPTTNLNSRRGKTRSQGSTTAAPPGPPPATPGDTPSAEKVTLTGNIRGAIIVSYFASMAPAEAIKLLRNSGTLNGVADDLNQLYKEVSEFLTKTQAGKKIVTQLEKASLAYLGAKTFKAAKRRVLAQEAALANRQDQSWYERDLQKRPVLSITWAVLAIFSIVALTYVFTP